VEVTTSSQIQAATDRFISKRLKQNKPFQGFIKTDEYARFLTMMHEALATQGKAIAAGLKGIDNPSIIQDDMEPMTDDQKAQLSQWIYRSLPRLSELVSENKVFLILKEAFEYSAKAQYKRWGVMVKTYDDIDFVLTNPFYIGSLKNQANYLLNRSTLDQTTLDQLIGLIEDMKMQGYTIDEVADEIVDQFDGDISLSRADMISRTETAQAMGSANLATMKENGVTTKHWVAAGSNVCAICQGNVDDGSIPVDGVFSSGDDSEPAHPRCECYTEADEIDLDSISIWDGE